MNILITGGNFANKGAELMLVSLIESISFRFPQAVICVSPLLKEKKKVEALGLKRLNFPLFHYGSSPMFEKLIKYPLLSLTYLKLKGFKWQGEIELKDVDVVFDISGFAFGDKWGIKPIRDLAVFTEDMKRRGTKFIMMPQAFGPFVHAEMISSMERVIKSSSLVFPRDEKSYEYVSSIAGNSGLPNVVLAPDITLTFQKKVEITDQVFNVPFCAIVPNERMLDKASTEWQKQYKNVLERSILKIVEESALHIVMLIHAQGASADFKVGDEIYNRIPKHLQSRISLVVEEDPVRLKSIISKATFIIGSRFHALASALSSNVPAIATSWLHKYEMLFKDFQCSEYSFSEPSDKMFLRIETFLNDSSRKAIVAKLKETNSHIAEKSENMWSLISTHMRQKLTK